MNLSVGRGWRLVARAIAIVGVAGWFYSGTIADRYFETLPRSPDARAGRVYGSNYHGIVIFETREERLRLKFAQDVSAGVILLGFLVGALEERRWRRLSGRL